MQDTDPTFWKRKLAAFLHDPPEKAYDFGPTHIERAKKHAANFGVGDLWKEMGGNPDWSAAAADRFVFPHGSKADSLGEDIKVAFVHPINGRDNDHGGRISLPAGRLAFPTQADAEQWLDEISPDWKDKDPHSLFLLAWRKWWEHAGAHHSGQGKGAELLPYLPADTRCPDGTIWHHCAIVSALEACRSDFKVPPEPAFLLFQVGPVQEFIAQARSTRDLWSGSYLLSWLMMHAIKAVADEAGPDCIIFPSLRGQPIYDFLEQQTLGSRPMDEDVLVPGIPNRFLAIVPEAFNVAIVKDAFEAEWKLIATQCREWLKNKGLAFEELYTSLFEQQVNAHWQITWHLTPWEPVQKSLETFAKLPLGRRNPLHLAKEIAEGIPKEHRDERCYRGGQLDPGWASNAHYQICQHSLDARRSLRDFDASPVDRSRKPGERDCLSGREEAVVQADKLQILESQSLRALFRHAEPLGAANLIKRVWHKAYLGRIAEVEGKKHLSKLQRDRQAFDSVPAVAAGGWLARIRGIMVENADVWADFIGLSETLAKVRPHLRGIAIPEAVNRTKKSDESEWLDQVDGEVFTERFWRSLNPETRVDSDVRAAAEAVRKLKRTHKLGEPSPYYAVLALDGDQIGKWLGGEKSPPVQSIITTKAIEYFCDRMLPAMTEQEKADFATALQKLTHEGKTPEKPETWDESWIWPPQSPQDWIRAWLGSPRPLSPSWHLQFSEALANFGLYAVRRIVEDVHHGQLIYSGGDDVLAMLPAEEAIACATDLQAAFQGRYAEMSEDCQKLFRPDAPEGFIWIAKPTRNDPTWPLLVPGPRMTVSIGIAIGHVKEPLQDMIQEAQKAEKRAKGAPETFVFDRSDAESANHGESWKPDSGWDRNAIAVTLFKRSGETIQWGAKFGSAAFGLLATLRAHFRPQWDQPDKEPTISGRFPYQLAQLLAAYDIVRPLTRQLCEITLREFDHVVSRQAKDLPDKASFRAQAEIYLGELLGFTWERPDKPGHPKAEHIASRPLRHFINLFLLEAFIRRQAD